MSVVEELQRNDPAVTKIRIHLRHETSDADLAQALGQNPFVTEIHLKVEGAWTTDWGTLLHAIAAREILVHVRMSGEIGGQERNSPAALVLVRAFLHAIQQNNSIRAVDLILLRFPADVSTFVDTASSITTLSLSNCVFAPTEKERGMRDLAAALQRNTNIKHLKLGVALEDSYAIPILQALQSNDFLTSLAILGTFSDETSHAMHQLLESTTSIARFELISVIFSSGEMFRPVAQSLIRSASVSALKFELCFFSNEESTAVFRSILQEKRNLTSLSFFHCFFTGGTEGQVHDAIISTLSRSDSSLRTLEFECGASSAGHFTVGQLQNLFRAVEKSKLERFKIGQIYSYKQLQSLRQSIPSMRIKELKIVFHSQIEEENAKEGLLEAVKDNFSLQALIGIQSERDIFDDEEKARLVFYADRNQRLDQWVDNPESVEGKVWPDSLALAEKAGPSSLFRGLRSVLGRDYVSLQSGRKCKHAQSYAQST